MPTLRNIKWYGYMPDFPDFRDHVYQASPRILKSLPKKIDLRPQMPPVYNQGALGSCTANAGSAIFQFNRIQQNVDWKCMPSRLFLYYNTRSLMGTVEQDSGASIRDTIKSMVSDGMCPASDWPYKIRQFDVKPPTRAYNFASKHTAVSYQRLYQNLDQLKGCLASGEAFIFGFSVYTSFESEEVAKTGVLNLPRRDERLVGGHAVMAVGYDEIISRFIIRNSWGVDWGQSGYFTMPYEFILNPNLAADFWTVKTVS